MLDSTDVKAIGDAMLLRIKGKLQTILTIVRDTISGR